MTPLALLLAIATTQYPGVDISAVQHGDTTTIQWVSAEATVCFASWTNMGQVPLSGSYTVKVSKNTLFTVYCNGTPAMFVTDGSPTSGWPKGATDQPASVYVWAKPPAPSTPAKVAVR